MSPHFQITVPEQIREILSRGATPEKTLQAPVIIHLFPQSGQVTLANWWGNKNFDDSSAAVGMFAIWRDLWLWPVCAGDERLCWKCIFFINRHWISPSRHCKLILRKDFTEPLSDEQTPWQPRFFNWSLAFLTVISYKERTSISCPTVPSWIIGPLPPGGLSCVSPNTQTHF